MNVGSKLRPIDPRWQIIVVGTSIILAVIVVWFLLRRLSGAFVPLSPACALAVGLFSALMVGVCRWSEWQPSSAAPSRFQLNNGLYLLTLGGLGLALSFPRVAPWATVCVWLPMLAEEAAWWFCGNVARHEVPVLATAMAGMAACESVADEAPTAMISRSTSGLAKVNGNSDEAAEAIDAPFDDEECSGDDDERELLPANVTQQLIRERSEGGGERLQGLLRCRFAAGEQIQNVHVAFCPPLDQIPTVTFHQLDGPSAQVKLGTSQTYGARFEIRLAAPAAEPADLLLQFEAIAQGESA